MIKNARIGGTMVLFIDCYAIKIKLIALVYLEL